MIAILDKVDEIDLLNATNCQGVCKARPVNAWIVLVKRMPSCRGRRWALMSMSKPPI